jgi:4-amino-4-deoxy-L-arabinose transferase-like glycosyltransferase
MESLRLALSILAATFIGWSILRLISFEKAGFFFLERFFIAYGLGFGFISLEMFIFRYFGITFSLFSIMIWWVPFALAAVLMGLLRRKPALYRTVRNDAKVTLFEKFLIYGISFEIIYAFFRALIKPIEAYDAVTTYAIRSKIFYLGRSIPHDFFYNLSTLFPHPDYPLNIPLSETFVYFFLGSINDQLVKAIFPLFFVSILGILYFAVRRISGRTAALLFTFLLATVPQFNNFATNAYHDVPFTYYCFVGTLFLLYWFTDTRSPGYLCISAVMTALSVWTKNEGFVYCVANILLLFIFLFANRRTIKQKALLIGLLYAGVILLVLAPWLSIKFTANLVNSDVGYTTRDQLNIFKQAYKIWPIFYEFQRQIFGPKKWNIIWIVSILSLVIYRRKIFREDQRYVTISLFMIISGYIFAYLVGRDGIWHMVGSTWSRMTMHFLPLTIYWLALLFSKPKLEI